MEERRKKEYMKRGERWGEGGIGELFRQARSQWRSRGGRGCKESAREKTGEAGEAGEPGETGEIGGASGSLGGRNRRPGQCKPGSLPDDIVALDIAVILLFFPFPHPPSRVGLVTPRVFLFAF